MSLPTQQAPQIQLPASMQQYYNPAANKALTQGVSQGFPVLSIKGKVWTVRAAKQDEIVMVQYPGHPPMPAQHLPCVIVGVNENLSKVFYLNGFQDGANEAPDCFSMDGRAPDPSSKQMQSNACGICPHNAWGSVILPSGQKGKRCSDSRRLAILIDRSVYNRDLGPVMLRVPAGSLTNLAKYAQDLQGMGLPYFGLVTTISFDPQAPHPKLVFTPFRALQEDEARSVTEMMGHESIARMLHASEAEDTAAPLPTDQPMFQPAPQQPAPQQPAYQQAAPAPTYQPAPGVAPQTGFGGAPAPAYQPHTPAPQAQTYAPPPVQQAPAPATPAPAAFPPATPQYQPAAPAPAGVPPHMGAPVQPPLQPAAQPPQPAVAQGPQPTFQPPMGGMPGLGGGMIPVAPAAPATPRTIEGQINHDQAPATHPAAPVQPVPQAPSQTAPVDQQQFPNHQAGAPAQTAPEAQNGVGPEPVVQVTDQNMASILKNLTGG